MKFDIKVFNFGKNSKIFGDFLVDRVTFANQNKTCGLTKTQVLLEDSHEISESEVFEQKVEVF